MVQPFSFISNNETTIKFPLPVIETSFNSCKDCKYCCQWCEYITPNGCNAPSDYELLTICKSFPILIGPGDGINPSLGLIDEQFPSNFGAFVPLGNKCQSVQDEKQRIVFQQAARYLNEGIRNFIIYYEENSITLYIKITDPSRNNLITNLKNII
ncbi:MAG: hypothetical protein HeimC3_12730 [Candidatus Heimdallarchaeota archaeon LC_3]|nr:MAG: hypothetical protein HeimC3_12730 [Candidatus Heimdallarchaeota archaeon LC_3]